jgi:alpha-galactosidase
MVQQQTRYVSLRLLVLGIIISLWTLTANPQQLANKTLSASVDTSSGSYRISTTGGAAILSSGASAELDHQWLRAADYPRHAATETAFSDSLGKGRAIMVTNSGVPGKPDLILILQIYDNSPYAALQLAIRNTTNKEVTLQSFRAVEALGDPVLNLGGHASADRILSDSYSEDRPALQIYDLGNAPKGMHRGIGSQLIYNRESKQALFLGALTADRLLTYFHLQAKEEGGSVGIASYSADITGTTEIQKDFDLRDAAPENQLEVNLPIAPGTELSSERLLLQYGPDPNRLLLTYGEIIRNLHQARVSTPTPIGWWGWTAFYGAINEGETLANADWQAAHLKSLGYKFFQVDEGYQYARGEYLGANSTQFPHGMRSTGYHVTKNGLTFGVWTSPFQVSSRSWVYENHKDWLVHNAKGEPIHTEYLWHQNSDLLYVLDTTNPGAQDYLRQTYKTLAREWGVRFIKLDFMDSSAIEGFMYRPNTTALEALRIGLQIIRGAVGEDVILDKDGSPMLTPVGLVDTGRISTDTAHSFAATKQSAVGVAARFYMHRDFFVNDPDAFNTTDQPFGHFRDMPKAVPLSAAQASIALSAVSGGMYEIGDDMLLLGASKDRLALVENEDLLNMAKLGKASTPIDLMTYDSTDEQPSIFFLRESPHQSILTVFNWSKSPRSRSLKLADLGLPENHSFSASDVFNRTENVSLSGGVMRIEAQGPESVRVVKIFDNDVPASAPKISFQVPAEGKAGETVSVAAAVDPAGAPAIGYLWDFGDGTTSESPKASHTYTTAGEYTVHLKVQGIDGIASTESAKVKVSGELRPYPNLLDNRRYREPND